MLISHAILLSARLFGKGESAQPPERIEVEGVREPGVLTFL